MVNREIVMEIFVLWIALLVAFMLIAVNLITHYDFIDISVLMSMGMLLIVGILHIADYIDKRWPA